MVFKCPSGFTASVVNGYVRHHNGGMAQAEDITRTYHHNIGLYRALESEIKFEIEQALAVSEIKYHSITTRVKDLPSLMKKVENKGITDPFTQIPDIVGGRVVTLFLSDITRIVDALRKCFDVSMVDNKIDDTDPRLFGYFSVHMHAKIRSTFQGTRYDQIKTLPFEVQVRTIAMDAWASASHHLAYKSEADVPPDLKRDFNALSGLYYVADKHFEMFFRSRAATREKIDSALDSKTNALYSQPLNADSLMLFLEKMYPDRDAPAGSDIGELLEELRAVEIKDLGELEQILNKYSEAFLKGEEEHPPQDINEVSGQTHDTKFTRVGVVRSTFDYTDRPLPNRWSTDFSDDDETDADQE